MTVIWRDPPDTKWVSRLKPLKENPGEWAVVHRTKRARTAYSYASRLTAGELAGLEITQDFEFRGHATDDGGGEIFARYIPKEERQPVTAA